MGAIWDCFMFNDELDLLEIRLEHLDAVVDRFVIVEADRTHAGVTKPLVFEQHRKRYERWLPRIDHVVARLSPIGDDAGERENEHRRALGDHLRESLHDGLSMVLIGDPDELPVPAALTHLDESLDGTIRLVLRHCIYYANWLLATPWDNSTLALRPDQLSHPMVRAQLGEAHGEWAGYQEHQLHDSGLHLSFLGGAEEIRAKWAAYRHQEHNRWPYNTAPHLERLVELGVHFEGREVLRRLGPNELDAQLKQLLGMPLAKQFFSFEPPPASIATARAYCAYTWLRTHGRLPKRVCDVIDAHPTLVTTFGKPFLVALDRGLAWRRRQPRPPDWKQPIVERWTDEATSASA